MTSRRKFISEITQLGIYSGIGIKLLEDSSLNNISSERRDFSWKKIKKCFPISKNKTLNLNSGSAGVMPKSVLNQYIQATEEINRFAPYEVYNGWQETITSIFQDLGKEFGISNGTLNLVRNTTEAINLILWGLPFKKNDEIIYADWDYPYVDYTLKNIKTQKGIKTKIIKKSLLNITDDEIVNFYKEKITPNTKLIVITWITHREGRILPIKKIRTLAKENDIEVLVDGAHVAGQIQHSITEIDPEYYATSLHKWFNGPLGTGLLYINDSVLEKISPTISYHPKLQSQSNKFDYLGTRAFQNIMGIKEALVFLNKTGIQKKEAYLKSLTDYWVSNVKDIPNLTIMTSSNHYCAINSIFIKDKSSQKMKAALKDKFKVHVKTSSYEHQKLNFIRISTNLFCDKKDLDRLIEGIHYIASNDI